MRGRGNEPLPLQKGQPLARNSCVLEQLDVRCSSPVSACWCQYSGAALPTGEGPLLQFAAASALAILGVLPVEMEVTSSPPTSHLVVQEMATNTLPTWSTQVSRASCNFILSSHEYAYASCECKSLKIRCVYCTGTGVTVFLVARKFCRSNRISQEIMSLAKKILPLARIGAGEIVAAP